MTQPTPYSRVYSFTNYQALNPTSPLPASSVDGEFNAIKTTLDEILDNLELIQRDDGSLANRSIGLDQLAPEIEVGWNAPVVWETSTTYSASQDTVFHGSSFYRCLEDHTSGTFATDLAASKWEEIVDLSSLPLADADQIAFTPAGGVASATVQAAIEELDADKAAASHTHTATAISDSTSAGRTLLTAADVAAQLTALGLTYGAPTYGEIRHTAAISAPTGWLFCYGQAVSRSTYASLFSAISISQSGTRTSGSAVVTGLSDTSNMRASMPVSGTGIPSSTTILSVDSGTQITLSQNATSSGTNTVVVAPHGVGDGSTTFNIPDGRGRVIAGRDDMGGSAASRLTSSYFGSVATRVGAANGSESNTLTSATIPSHTHTASVTDPGHTHFVVKDSSTPSGTAMTSSNALAQSANFTSDDSYILRGKTGPADVGLSSSATTGITVSNSSTGSGGAHANVQPTMIENFIIFAGA